MPMTLVTVAFPTFNSYQYIDKSLQSLLVQDYENIEIIIIDDCSCDGSYEKCKEYANSHDNIKLFKNDKNIGSWDNFKKCIDIGNGKYCVWCCPGDLWHKSFISMQVEKMESDENSVICLCGSEIVDEKSNEVIEEIIIDKHWEYLFRNKYLLARVAPVKPLINRDVRPHLSAHTMRNRKVYLDSINAFNKVGPILNERQLLCHQVLMGNVVYLSDNLFSKMAHIEKASVRAKQDPTIQAQSNNHYNICVAMQLAKSAFYNNKLDVKDKLYLVLVAVNYFFLEKIHSMKIYLVSLARNILPDKIYTMIKEKYKKFIQ